MHRYSTHTLLFLSEWSSTISSTTLARKRKLFKSPFLFGFKSENEVRHLLRLKLGISTTLDYSRDTFWLHLVLGVISVAWLDQTCPSALLHQAGYLNMLEIFCWRGKPKHTAGFGVCGFNRKRHINLSYTPVSCLSVQNAQSQRCRYKTNKEKKRKT